VLLMATSYQFLPGQYRLLITISVFKNHEIEQEIYINEFHHSLPGFGMHKAI
jgi:hypothetical protein